MFLSIFMFLSMYVSIYCMYVLILPNKNRSINLKLVDDDDGRTGGQTPRVPANCRGHLKCLPIITTFSLYKSEIYKRANVSRTCYPDGLVIEILELKANQYFLFYSSS